MITRSQPGQTRYRMANGKLPETLQMLVPLYLARIPHDVLTGASLNYQRSSDTEFSLQSIGWSHEEVQGNGPQFRGSQSPDSAEWTWRSGR